MSKTEGWATSVNREKSVLSAHEKLNIVSKIKRSNFYLYSNVPPLPAYRLGPKACSLFVEEGEEQGVEGYSRPQDVTLGIVRRIEREQPFPPDDSV